MAGVQEENRRRFALLLIGLGIFLILLGLGLGTHHYHALASQREGLNPSDPPAIQLSRSQQARMIQQVLFLTLVLAGILGISLYAFKVWSRRFRQMLFRRPAPPTPSEDVWTMHRLPDDSRPEEFSGPGDYETDRQK